MRRKISELDGRAAISRWRSLRAEGAATALTRSELATAVRFSLEEFGSRYPGGSVEVRVPPFGVVQAIEGVRHTRGTPPAIIETSAHVWLELATGELNWGDAVRNGQLNASGERADLTERLPLFISPKISDAANAATVCSANEAP